jgi:cell wall-associated NlpC family hydrolase
MLKINPVILSFLFTAISGNGYAQYTQMIVDNNNRVMPIFFHDDPSPQQVRIEKAHLASPSSQVYKHPSPIVIPTRTVKPAVQQRTISRDPLTGPYFITPERHRVMAAAHDLLGTPYIYGGNNPARGLDCSSLMQFIHKNALGVKIPRTAAEQRKRSKTINYSNLQPGDMLFFKIDSRNNHVGIYIGHGKFIHASSSNRRAIIDSMNTPYWKKRFVKFGSYLDS